MRRLLLVGWDAADWKVINPLLARGEMPHLERVIRTGVRGNIATIYPALSPMLWTSIATGKRPFRHGILGFTEPTVDGLAVRPVSILGRGTRAIWNILNLNGKRSLVVGWWPSHPAEPINGAMVSDLYPLKGASEPGTPMVPGTVWPGELAGRLQELRIHPSEISGEMLRLFVPEAHKVDQEKDRSLYDLATIIAETLSIHAAATDLMESESWDFAGIYYSGIDHFSHRFMRYHAGKGVETGGADPSFYRGIVANAYRYHDVMLGRLMALAGPECSVMVVSDHGFHSDRLLPDYIPAEAAGPAVEHRHFGIFCLTGPGVKRNDIVYGASILDIAPTVLRLFDLPTARDMDGRPLLNAFENTGGPEPIASWDEAAGEDGCHPTEAKYDSKASAEALRQLVDLGYVAPPSEDARKAVDDCLREREYNLARSYMGAGHADLAEPILRGLIARDEEEGRFRVALLECLHAQGKLAQCREALDAFDAACAEFAPRALEELKLRRAEQPDEMLSGERNPKVRREQFERRTLAEKAHGFAGERLLARCRLALAERKSPRQRDNARALLDRLSKRLRGGGGLALFLAEGYAVLGDDDRALEMAKRARRADKDDWRAIGIEARIHARAKRFEKTVECALESLSLIYFQPEMHYLLGSALRRLGEKEKAEQSLRVALAQAPGMALAREELARLLRHDLTRAGEAAEHMVIAARQREQVKSARAKRGRAQAMENAPDVEEVPLSFERNAAAPPLDRARVVTVVTGLPRSGTSMMMQMLAAAGIRPYTDNRRQPDDDNPRGYFEHAQATGLARDSSWVPCARGRAVKIVAQLVPHLPAGEEYRIVFMHRNFAEVVASQRAMLRRLGRKGGRLSDAELTRAFTQQLVRVHSWLKRHPEIPVLAVSYGGAIEDPPATAERLEKFFGAPFDAAAAAQAVVASLRRQTASEA